VRFEQTPGGSIVLTYDLVSSDPADAVEIVVEVSKDGGRTFGMKPTSVSGDVGPGIRPGQAKRIVWEASKDVEALVLDQFRFNVRAASAPTQPARGSLTIRTVPPGATVIVDGFERGRTPLTLTNVPVGMLQVVVRRSGYLDNRQAIAIAPGENDLDIALTLSPASPATPKSASASPARRGGINPLVWVGLAGAGVAGGVAAASGGGSAGSPPVGNTPPPPVGNTPPLPVNCQFSLESTDIRFPESGTERTFNVTISPANCVDPDWSVPVRNPASWLTVEKRTATSFLLNALPNYSGSNRSVAFVVAGVMARLEQAAGGPCTFTATWGLDADSRGPTFTSVPGDCEGPLCGDRRLTVTATNSCEGIRELNVQGVPPWLSVSYASPAGNTRIVNFAVAQRNPLGVSRTVTVTLFQPYGPTTAPPLTVTQCAARCP
jgi:hypothetical protein